MSLFLATFSNGLTSLSYKDGHTTVPARSSTVDDMTGTGVPIGLFAWPPRAVVSANRRAGAPVSGPVLARCADQFRQLSDLRVVRGVEGVVYDRRQPGKINIAGVPAGAQRLGEHSRRVVHLQPRRRPGEVPVQVADLHGRRPLLCL